MCVKKKVSIVIPTYNHLEDALRPCIESLYQYTNYENIELIIVSNGSTDGTKEYLDGIKLKDKPWEVKTLFFDEPLGYTKATNEGLKIATGDYILFLNNDVLFQGQVPDTWLNMLLKPFKENPKTGISCVLKGFCECTGRYFSVFFCAMTTKKILDETGGLLDVIFSPGGGEDADFSHKVENLGYDVIQVPEEGLLPMHSDPKEYGVCVGGFPLYHHGEATMLDGVSVPNWNDIIAKNFNILYNRYYVNGKIKLNVGCGDLKFPDYFNIDLQGDNECLKLDCSRLDRYFMPEYVDSIVAIHLFEHFDPFIVQGVLESWYKILRYGGELIMEMPNIEELCKHFVYSDKQKRYEYLNCIYGTVTKNFPHRFAYYPEILFDHLNAVGFKDIKFTQPCYNYMGFNMRVECIK